MAFLQKLARSIFWHLLLASALWQVWKWALEPPTIPFCCCAWFKEQNSCTLLAWCGYSTDLWKLQLDCNRSRGYKIKVHENDFNRTEHCVNICVQAYCMNESDIIKVGGSAFCKVEVFLQEKRLHCAKLWKS